MCRISNAAAKSWCILLHRLYALTIMKDFNENFCITPASCKACNTSDSSVYLPKVEKNPIQYERSHIYEQVIICRRLLCLLLHSGLSNCKIVGDNNCFSGTFLNDFLVCFIVSCRRFIYLRKMPHLLKSILFLNHLTSFPSNPHGADILLTTC